MLSWDSWSGTGPFFQGWAGHGARSSSASEASCFQQKSGPALKMRLPFGRGWCLGGEGDVSSPTKKLEHVRQRFRPGGGKLPLSPLRGVAYSQPRCLQAGAAPSATWRRCVLGAPLPSSCRKNWQ